MEPMIVIAQAVGREILRDRAFSALPGAPVQPYVAPRHRMRRLLAVLARIVRRPRPAPAPALPPAQLRTGCANPT